jgi:hypothetical protein
MTVERRRMTPDEVTLARAFANVTFPPATTHNRIARNLADRVSAALIGHPVWGLISEGEARVMRNIAWRFRRQLPRALRPATKPVRQPPAAASAPAPSPAADDCRDPGGAR